MALCSYVRENGRVQISREDLCRRYASLSDGELLAIDPGDLTGLALECYESEVESRRLSEEMTQGEAPVEVYTQDGPPPDWLETAATACSFQSGHGQRYAEDAARACEVLSDAGVPCRVVDEQEEGRPALMSVVVPGALILKAASILDRDLFNEELEENWRVHFDALSDEELHALSAEDLCAGILDRATRLKRIFEEALASRDS